MTSQTSDYTLENVKPVDGGYLGTIGDKQVLILTKGETLTAPTQATDVHTEGRALVQQIHELHGIRARLAADEAEYGTGYEYEQSFLDRRALLTIIQGQAIKLGAVQQLLNSARIHGNHVLYATEVNYAIGGAQ